MACHDEVLTAARAVLARTGRSRFGIPEVLREMADSGYAEFTIRTQMHLDVAQTRPTTTQLRTNISGVLGTSTRYADK